MAETRKRQRLSNVPVFTLCISNKDFNHNSSDDAFKKSNILKCSKNPMANTAAMPDDMVDAEAGVFERGLLNRKYMTKYGFDSDYWTMDEREIVTMQNAYEKIYGKPLPILNVGKPRRGTYCENVVTLETGKNVIDPLIFAGHPFLLTSDDGDKIAFKYSTWWDGALMARTPIPSIPPIPSIVAALKRIERIEDANVWLQQNDHRLPTVCGKLFDPRTNSEFREELVQNIEYVYTDTVGEKENILLMKTDPTIRGQKIADTLYIELICCGIKGSSKALVGPGGLADALAIKFKKSRLLLSTLFKPSTLYNRYDYQFTDFNSLVSASSRTTN